MLVEDPTKNWPILQSRNRTKNWPMLQSRRPYKELALY